MIDISLVKVVSKEALQGSNTFPSDVKLKALIREGKAFVDFIYGGIPNIEQPRVIATKAIRHGMQDSNLLAKVVDCTIDCPNVLSESTLYTAWLNGDFDGTSKLICGKYSVEYTGHINYSLY